MTHHKGDSNPLQQAVEVLSESGFEGLAQAIELLNERGHEDRTRGVPRSRTLSAQRASSRLRQWLQAQESRDPSWQAPVERPAGTRRKHAGRLVLSASARERPSKRTGRQ